MSTVSVAAGLLLSLQRVPTLVWAFAGGAAFFLYNLYAHQDALLYHPLIPGLPSRSCSSNPSPYKSPADPPWSMRHDNLTLTTRDQVRLNAWFVYAPEGVDSASAPTIVFFHANAGNMGLRLPNVRLLRDWLDANVLIFDYRGFGDSEGAPSEPGLEIDSDAVLDYVASRSDIDKRKVFFFGRSLGGAVAVRAAVNRPTEVRGLILENTFTSISEMVDHVMPLLARLKWLVLRIGWASVDIIGKLDQPMLFISGAEDKLVLPAMMKRLFAAASASTDRRFVAIAGGDHNDTFQKGGEEYALAIREFVRSVLGPLRTTPRPAAAGPPSAALEAAELQAVPLGAAPSALDVLPGLREL